MIYIGIDPGLNKTGWGVVKKDEGKYTLLAADSIITKSNIPIGMRLLNIYQKLDEVLSQWEPQIGAIENTYVNSNNASSLLLAQARGVALLCLAKHDIIPREYQAKTIKKMLTNSGNADKIQVKTMLSHFLECDLNLFPPDAVDALAIATCAAW